MSDSAKDQHTSFDVFLCYNSKDKYEVKKIAKQLKAYRVRPWLDEWELPPGQPWQPLIEEQIKKIPSAAVFVSKNDMGPWQKQEVSAWLEQFVKRNCPVIPVLLYSAPEQPDLPFFLKNMTWVDFREQESEPLKRLVWGIKQQKPDSLVNHTFHMSISPHTGNDHDSSQNTLFEHYSPLDLPFNKKKSTEQRKTQPVSRRFANNQDVRWEQVQSEEKPATAQIVQQIDQPIVANLGQSPQEETPLPLGTRPVQKSMITSASQELALVDDPRFTGLEPMLVCVPRQPEKALALRGVRRGQQLPVQAFEIGEYPVTNIEYKRFVEANEHHRVPKHWKEGTFPPGEATHPVVGITKREAEAYCKWLSGSGKRYRLPTEWEWEWAATGPDEWKYPWGDHFAKDRCN